jgi:hypothetical protein
MPLSPEYKKKHPKAPEDILVGEHFAIMTPVSNYGDDGRTGGDYWDYEVFSTRQEWEAEIQRLTLALKRFVPLHAVRPKVTPSVSVSLTSVPA